MPARTFLGRVPRKRDAYWLNILSHSSALKGAIRSLNTGEIDRTLQWGCSSVGRAVALQAIGQEFESPQLHQLDCWACSSVG
jgi:hypothetical protein